MRVYFRGTLEKGTSTVPRPWRDDFIIKEGNTYFKSWNSVPLKAFIRCHLNIYLIIKSYTSSTYYRDA